MRSLNFQEWKAVFIKKGDAHMWSSRTRVDHVRTNFALKIIYPTILHYKYMLILRMFITLTSCFYNDYRIPTIKFWDLYNFYRLHSKRQVCVSWDPISIATRKKSKFYQWSNNSYSQHLRWWVSEMSSL